MGARGRVAGLLGLTIGGALIVLASPGILTTGGGSAGAVPESYIVQGHYLADAAAAVKAVGGEVTHELGIIGAVGARLTLAQRSVLSELDGIRGLHADRAVKTVNMPYPTSIWITTETAVAAPSGVNGLPAEGWSGGEILELENPSLEPGVTAGTLNRRLDFDDFADDGDARVDALHLVSRDMVVGSNSIQLLEGDLLLSTVYIEPVTDSHDNSLTAYSADVVAFRPDVAGDYSAGSIFRLVNTWDLGMSELSCESVTGSM